MCYKLKMNIIFYLIGFANFAYSAAAQSDIPIEIELSIAWHEASENGFKRAKEIVKKYPALINHVYIENLGYGRKNERTLLSYAVNNNRLDKIDFLLTQGADVNIQLQWDSRSDRPDKRETVLMALSSFWTLVYPEQQIMFKQLLQEGIDFSLRDSGGRSVRDILLKTDLKNRVMDRNLGGLVALLDEKQLQQEAFTAHWTSHILPLIVNGCGLDERELAKIIAGYAHPSYKELGALMRKKSYREIRERTSEENLIQSPKNKETCSCVIS